MNHFRIFILILILLGFYNTKAQIFYEHEFGFNTGIYQLRSDYGIDQDSETNFGNQGVAFSFSYYLNMASRRTANKFQQHFKYRLDLIFASVDLEHYGPYISDPRLDAMTGSFTNLGFGAGLEFYPFGVNVQSLSRYASFFEKFSPYTSVGLGVNMVTPSAESSLEGGLNNISNVFPTFIPETEDNGINTENRTVGSLNLRVGTRYRISSRGGLMLESSWMLFGSDLVDGLSPIGPQNKNNDWSWGINIGYTYLLF